MINLDYLTLNSFLFENLDFFIGARIQKIQQPSRRELILALRNNGESRKLYININPQTYHIAFMSEENEKKRNITIPKKPPMFCMLLRKYIEGAKISDATVIENERIFELHIEAFDELSERITLCLTVELMGKHSNIILYNRESSIIIGCAHNIGPEKSRYRELQGGLKYIYPPKVNKPSEIKEPLYKLLADNNKNFTTINELIDNYYSDIQFEIDLKTEKSQLLEIANSKSKKTKNAISKINSLLKKRDNTEKYKLYGELLTANLHQKCDYQKSIEIFDYTNNKNIVIDLDETKTLNENAQRYYKLYTKSKTTKEKSEEMLKNLNIEFEYIENIIYSINNAKSISDLDDIKSELGVADKEKQNKTQKISVEKINIEGFEVYIGKNNKQNDYIVSKLSKDDDYWFHTRLCAGSHVLLKTNGNTPDKNVIWECCKLARKYSSATMPSKVGVIYTKAINLKKPPAAPLGYVTYKNEQEVLVD